MEGGGGLVGGEVRRRYYCGGWERGVVRGGGWGLSRRAGSYDTSGGRGADNA